MRFIDTAAFCLPEEEEGGREAFRLKDSQSDFQCCDTYGQPIEITPCIDGEICATVASRIIIYFTAYNNRFYIEPD